MIEYQYNCVQPNTLEELEFIVDNNEEIEMAKFVRIIGEDNFNTLTESLGYTDDFPIKDDWAVTYHTGKLKDGTVFAYLQHSCIEYVFY